MSADMSGRSKGMVRKLSEFIVLIKGGGEVASGIAHRLHRSHFKVCLTEVVNPLAVSRGTTFSEAVFDGTKVIEGVRAELVSSSPEEIYKVWRQGNIPIVIDPEVSVKEKIQLDVLVDATMAKRNTGTKITDAPLVIGVGPGFYAGRDVHMVIESNHSNNLGGIILEGEGEKDTTTLRRGLAESLFPEQLSILCSLGNNYLFCYVVRGDIILLNFNWAGRYRLACLLTVEVFE